LIKQTTVVTQTLFHTAKNVWEVGWLVGWFLTALSAQIGYIVP